MKKYILLLLHISLISNLAFAQQRNVLTVDGMIPCSPVSTFYGLINLAKQVPNNYKINHLKQATFNYDPSKGVAVSANGLNDALKNQDAVNILGIAHDYGGIVLKNMNNPAITAMILDGVPNNGSELIKKIITKQGGGSAFGLKVFSDLKAWSGAENCATCNFEGTLDAFIKEIQANATAWKDIDPDSPFVGTKPTVPYAILWGNIERLGLSSLLSSAAASSTTTANNFIGSCINEKLIEENSKLKRKKNRAILDAIFTTASNLKSLLSPIKVTTTTNTTTNTKETSISGISSDAVKNLITSLVKDIDEISKVDKEIKNLLKCEVYLQAMNAQWDLLVSGNQKKVVTLTTTIIGDPAAFQDCLSNCSDPDPQVQGWCINNCYLNYNGSSDETIIINTYVSITRPHDGLLTDIEQKLDGAAKTYELPSVNHLQEPDWEQKPVNAAFIDLFEGNAGIAFKVPK